MGTVAKSADTTIWPGGSRGPQSLWHVVQPDGSLKMVGAPEARVVFKSRQAAPAAVPADDPLASVPDERMVAALTARGYRVTKTAESMAQV